MEEIIELVGEMSPYKRIILLIALLWVCIGITSFATTFGFILSGIVTIVLVAYVTKIFK